MSLRPRLLLCFFAVTLAWHTLTETQWIRDQEERKRDDGEEEGQERERRERLTQAHLLLPILCLPLSLLRRRCPRSAPRQDSRGRARDNGHRDERGQQWQQQHQRRQAVTITSGHLSRQRERERAVSDTEASKEGMQGRTVGSSSRATDTNAEGGGDERREKRGREQRCVLQSSSGASVETLCFPNTRLPHNCTTRERLTKVGVCWQQESSSISRCLPSLHGRPWNGRQQKQLFSLLRRRRLS